MLNYINSLYELELESGRLDFESDLGYREALRCFSVQYEDIYLAGDPKLCEALFSSCFDLEYYVSRAAFSYGLRLGIALSRWGGGLSAL